MIASQADSTQEDDELEQLLKNLGEGGSSGNPEEHLQGILEGMMTQLMSKDVLYEPLKELHEKVWTTLNIAISF